MALAVKDLPDNARDSRDSALIPTSGRSPGGGHVNPLQYSCLENPVDRGAWWAIVHRVAESDIAEVTWHTHIHTHTHIYMCVYLHTHQVYFS